MSRGTLGGRTLHSSDRRFLGIGGRKFVDSYTCFVFDACLQKRQMHIISLVKGVACACCHRTRFTGEGSATNVDADTSLGVINPPTCHDRHRYNRCRWKDALITQNPPNKAILLPGEKPKYLWRPLSAQVLEKPPKIFGNQMKFNYPRLLLFAQGGLARPRQ